MRLIRILAFLFVIQQCHAASLGPYNTSSVRDASPTSRLQVHLVPHSHDDAGWLKTVDQYYWGIRQDIQVAGVQYILDTVIQSLQANENRRFTFAEMAFFTRWWAQQDEDTQASVRRLVENGQLNFVNGGYVQHDEAAAHYVAMIDQTTRGHTFLKKEFGITPRIGWQIDPFGHSSIQAGLLGYSLGFDALFFGRSDYDNMKVRSNNKQLEHLWQGTGDSNEMLKDDFLFTGNFASGNYGPPSGFWWEWTGTKDAIIADDPDLDEYNVDDKVEHFVQKCLEIGNITVGDDIMLTMGSDFHYSNAHVWYKNLDKLIHYVNKDGRINVFYSSPEDYVAAKHSYNHSWPVKIDDYFPYADTPHSYWTGYFSSRPASKGYIRYATSYLQAARQLEAYVGKTKPHNDTMEDRSTTDTLEAAVSLCQHHDSITGTAKQHVVNDYHARIHRGLQEAQNVVMRALAHLIADDNFLKNPMDSMEHHHATLHPSLAHPSNTIQLEGCFHLNTSSCAPSVELSRAGVSIFVVAYNPLAWSRTSPIRFPISTQSTCHWKVVGPSGETVDSQIVGIDQSTQSLQTLLGHINATDPAANGDAEVVFMAELPPLGYSSFLIEPVILLPQTADRCTQKELPQIRTGRKSPSKGLDEKEKGETAAVISNGLIHIAFDESTGMMRSMSLENGPSVQFSADFRWYNASDGLDSDEDRGQASGAYIFRPNGQYAVADTDDDNNNDNNDNNDPRGLLYNCSLRLCTLLPPFFGRRGRQKSTTLSRNHPTRKMNTTVVALEIRHGDQVSEAHQVFSDWATLTTRIYNGQRYVEFEWTVDPIPVKGDINNTPLGKEIVIVYASNIASGDEFFTDANGRSMVRRRLNHRSTWHLNVTEPVAGNYYPITAAASIQEPGRSNLQLTVLTDRAQGGASLRSGEIELMVHRRVLVDDRRGVEEPLNETACGCTDCDCPGLVVRGKHWVLLSQNQTENSSDENAIERRHLQQLMNDPVILGFGPIPRHPGMPCQGGKIGGCSTGGGFMRLRRFFSITNDHILHRGVHLLTLMRTSGHKLLVRLAHLLDQDESKAGFTEDVGALLAPFHCTNQGAHGIVELSLSGNQRKRDAMERRMKFKSGKRMDVDDNDTDGEHRLIYSHHANATEVGYNSSWLVHLDPMQIRTFEIDC